ncbi:lysophospholipase [Dioszegia hungarica]|uniref:Lysophospholipase n=1 Tax=Dioszegia hungarica TaxID=4972 RepID=A0AA38HFL4_9TREE|nr:lysophospholipase [Dioszegia hungarica]KAI9638156.1 lysophospholipase [Dioszegia hungarica]
MPRQNPLWELVEPYLASTGLYKVPDPTYGRYTHRAHPSHRTLLDNPGCTHTYRRAFLRPYSSFPTWQEAYDSTEIIHSEDVQLTEEEIISGNERGGRWVCYSVWEAKGEPEGGWTHGGDGRGKDVILVHGLSDYGLRYAPHVQYFLKAGFRVIIPDLPSYGRSTGMHSYLPSLLLLPAALHVVLTDVVRNDLAHGREQRKVFTCGASMGGWTVLYYLLKYPPSSSATLLAEDAGRADETPPPLGQGQGYADAERRKADEKARVQVAGAFVLCPMVQVSSSSRPYKVTEYIGRGLKYVAGSLPLASAVRGQVSDDPRVEEDFFADPICYHGLLRVATGLSCLEGMDELMARAKEIDAPIKIIHGSSDRATSHLGTLKLFGMLPHEDKEIEIYEGYEHVMTKVGIDAADDAKRQRVLADWLSWMTKRC